MYGESLHADHRGEWTYDLAWKPLAGFPVRAGWLAAIRTAQRQLRAGLDIPVPVLLACSTRSFRGTRWHDSAALADAVLDVEHMVRWAPRLGRHVTVARFDGGKHDLVLSGPAVREQVFTEVGRWAERLPRRRPDPPRRRRTDRSPGACHRHPDRLGIPDPHRSPDHLTSHTGRRRGRAPGSPRRGPPPPSLRGNDHPPTPT